MGRWQRFVSLPWALAVLIMVGIIWGNSLVPGEGSGQLSMAVLEAARGFLDGLGLPSGWLTNFLVRKTAHFTEYAVLGVLVSQALAPALAHDARFYTVVACILVLVPSCDEVIQLSVAGRSGQLSDVLLDCCGAATGVLLRAACAGLRRRRTGDVDAR